MLMLKPKAQVHIGRILHVEEINMLNCQGFLAPSGAQGVTLSVRPAQSAIKVSQSTSF